MEVGLVDERDSGWEDGSPRFRVYFFAGDGGGHTTWTYDITGADVLDVITWAQAEAGEDRMYAVALVRDEHLQLNGGLTRMERGLVWLLGIDANTNPDTQSEAERLAREGMRQRRGMRVVKDSGE